MRIAGGQLPVSKTTGRRRGGLLVVEMSQKTRRKAVGVARRHTYGVRALRLLLPLLVVGLAGIYSLFLRSQFALGTGTFTPGKVELTADDLKMKNPSYFGVSKDGGRYEVRAAEAAVDFAQTGPIRLTLIDGDLVQQNGVVTKLQAGKGLLDQKKNELELYDGVNIDASNGMKAHLKRAMIYTKENRVVSKDAVVATMPTGSVKANAMDLLTKERKGSFQGNVQVSLVQGVDVQGRANIGVGRDTKQPVTVRSETLKIDDTARVADFAGGVLATQGESTLKAATLHLEYEGKADLPGVGGKSAADPQPDEAKAQLTKLQARTGVEIVQGADRRATADAADFDIKADTALLTGNVHVQQGKNLMRGRRMLVDRKAGRMKLEAPAEAGLPLGRIATTFYQNQGTAKPGAAAKPKPVSEDSGGIMQFRTDPNAPIDIEAETLDVSDSSKTAVFKGKVRAQQGDFVVQAPELSAIYSGQTGLLAPASDADAALQKVGAQIQRIDARGGVVITSKDGQEAIGQTAVFDTKSNTMLLSGGVQVKQGRNVSVGSRLRVDMTTGLANLENDPTGADTPVAAQVVPGGAAADPKAATCAPGRQCVIFYPDDAKEKQKQRVAPALKKLTVDGWSSTTSPSPNPKAP